MGAAALVWARAEWRRRWRSLVALGIGLGLAGAVVLTALAGSERTRTGYQRLVDRTDRYDVQVQDDTEGAPLLDHVGDLPGVVASDRVIVTFQALARNGSAAIEDLVLVAGAEDGFGRRFDRPLLEAGRMPDQDRPSEILLNNIAADALDARVGDRITVNPLTGEQFFASVLGGQPPAAVERGDLRLTVTGIGRLPDDADEPNPAAIVSSQVFEKEDIGFFDNQVWVRLADGQDGVEQFVAAVEARPEHDPGLVFFTAAQDSDDRVIDTLAVQRVALLAFALVALVVVAVAGGQAISRQLAGSAVDGEILLALGLGRGARVGALTLPFIGVASIAMVVAVVAATSASSLLPVGFARRIEPDPGSYLYPWITGPVVVLLIGFVVGLAALAAVGQTRRRSETGANDRPSRTATVAAALGAGPSAVTGLRLALEPGRGRIRLPIRSTLGGVALGVGGVTAVLTFAASLDRLLTDPVLHGGPWSASIPAGAEEDQAEGEPDVIALFSSRLDDLPDVLTATVTDQRSVTIGGEELVATSLRHLRGAAEVPYLDGRPPAGPDEVAIGPDALDRLGAEVGSRVSALGAGGATVQLKVVGSPLVAIEETFDRIAVMTAPGLDRLERSGGARNIYVTTDGPPEAALAPLAGDVEIDGPLVPTAISNLEEARGIPNALALFLGALAIAALVHSLVLGLRRRRRDIAVLRVLGFQRAQVTAVAAVQATAVMVIGAAIGIPLGVAAGRWAWTQFANGLNVVVRPEVPLFLVVVVALIGVVAANLFALPRAWAARRLSPSAVLRTE